MKKLIILAVSVFVLFTSCQQRPQVFGVYIDGTLGSIEYIMQKYQ